MRHIKINTVLLYIVAFFLVYESGTLPSIISINDMYMDKILLFFFMGLVAVSALQRKKNINILAFWSILFIVFVILNSFVCLRTTPNLIYRLLIFLLIYLVLLFADQRRINFDELICSIIVFMAVVSLIIYVATHILNIPIPYSYFYLKKNGIRYISYANLYFEQGYANQQFGLSLYRMTGPFWEPGVYQIFLNYALYKYAFKENVSKFIPIVLVVDLFLTMSAAGWLCAIGIIVLRLSSSKRMTCKSKILISMLLITIGFCAASFVISAKFSETYANKSSAFIRINDFLLAAELFVENPICGTGFNNTKPFELRNVYNTTAYLGSSNGFMTIAYSTGIVGLVFVLLPFIIHISRTHKYDKCQSVFYACMILFFNFVEPVYYFPFMLYVLAKEYHLMFRRIPKT